MTQPTINVRAAFAANPFDADSTLVWTDISAYVRTDEPITIRRGRQDELGRIEAGTCSLVLDNHDRRFDPMYTAGAYYPNVLPHKRIQVRALYGGSYYNLFTGYVEDWGQDYPLYGGDSRCAVRAVDALALIAGDTVTITSLPPGESSGNAVRTALTHVGWPVATDYVYTYGQTLVPAGSYTDQNALSYIQQIVESEDGLCYVGPDGYINFQDRHWRLSHASSYGTFGDTAGELPYSGITMSYDNSWIWNVAQITRRSGTVQEASDSASVATYRSRTYVKSDLLMGTNNDALGLAEWIVARYKNAQLRIKALELDGNADANLWTHVLNRDLSHMIVVRRRPGGIGAMIEQSSRIESIEYEITSTSWRTSWSLSPETTMAFLTLNDAALGALDSNALAF